MELEQIVSQFSAFCYVPVTCYRQDQVFFQTPDLAFLHQLTSRIVAQIDPGAQAVQCLFTDELLCIGVLAIAGSDDWLLLGPITSMPCDNLRAQRILRRYGLPSTLTGELLSYFSDTPKYALHKFATLLIVAHYLFNRQTINTMDILPAIYHDTLPDVSELPVNPLPNIQKNIDKADIFHNSQTFERRLFALVRYGKIAELNSFFSQIADSGNIGALAPDMLRNYKNMVISSIALASRAAVEGGLDYETAMRQADVFIQKVEMAPDISYLPGLNHQMLRTYTRMVADRKIGSPDSMTAVKIYNYVEQNVTQKLTTTQIAEVLGLSRSYLSSQFKKETGMNLSDFINKVKIDQAKVLLSTTRESSASIADQLAFASQSHFLTIFRKFAGMTPKEYRKSHGDLG
ncbi:MAG TPA: hypothetical protein DCM45_06525 [Clostridiales bacterium]|nr:hypothetical protein [Clostridiales bacterium]